MKNKKRIPKKVTRLWTQRNGSKIRICDMSDYHLKNAIAMLVRSVPQVKGSISYPMFQGEMAQYYAEQEYDRLQEASDEEIFPILNYLYQERDRRTELAKARTPIKLTSEIICVFCKKPRKYIPMGSSCPKAFHKTHTYGRKYSIKK